MSEQQIEQQPLTPFETSLNANQRRHFHIVVGQTLMHANTVALPETAPYDWDEVRDLLETMTSVSDKESPTCSFALEGILERLYGFYAHDVESNNVLQPVVLGIAMATDRLPAVSRYFRGFSDIDWGKYAGHLAQRYAYDVCVAGQPAPSARDEPSQYIPDRMAQGQFGLEALSAINTFATCGKITPDEGVERKKDLLDIMFSRINMIEPTVIGDLLVEAMAIGYEGIESVALHIERIMPDLYTNPVLGLPTVKVIEGILRKTPLEYIEEHELVIVYELLPRTHEKYRQGLQKRLTELPEDSLQRRRADLLFRAGGSELLKLQLKELATKGKASSPLDALKTVTLQEIGGEAEEFTLDSGNPLWPELKNELIQLISPRNSSVGEALALFGVKEVGEAGRKQFSEAMRTVVGQIKSGAFDTERLSASPRCIVTELIFLSYMGVGYGFKSAAIAKYRQERGHGAGN